MFNDYLKQMANSRLYKSFKITAIISLVPILVVLFFGVMILFVDGPEKDNFLDMKDGLVRMYLVYLSIAIYNVFVYLGIFKSVHNIKVHNKFSYKTISNFSFGMFIAILICCAIRSIMFFINWDIKYYSLLITAIGIVLFFGFIHLLNNRVLRKATERPYKNPTITHLCFYAFAISKFFINFVIFVNGIFFVQPSSYEFETSTLLMRYSVGILFIILSLTMVTIDILLLCMLFKHKRYFKNNKDMQDYTL